MTSQDRISIDANDRRSPKDLPPIMTSFHDKPLPPIREPRARPPPLAHLRNRHMDDKKADSVDGTPPKRQPSKPKKEGSKMSVFSLFSRPKVEKFRGYTEPGLSLPPIDESLSRAVTPEPRTEKRSTDKSQPPVPRTETAMSWRTRDPSRSFRECRTSGEGTARPARRRRNSWVPPPLFQAYAQSVKASKAQTADSTVPLQMSRRRRDSHELSREPGKPHRNASISSIQYSGLPKKIFALTSTGYLLQYTDQGMSERLPERVLQLTSESVAFVCDTVPGEPYVLHVAQTAEVRESVVSSSISFLSRMGLRGSLARKEASTLLMVFQSSQDMDSWIAAVRKQIQILGGDPSQVDGGRANEEEGEEEKYDEKAAAVDNREDLLQFPDRCVSAIDLDVDGDVSLIHSRSASLVDVDQESASSTTTPPRSRASSKDITASPKQQPSPVKSKAEACTDDGKTPSSLHAATPRDSPMSGAPGDSAANADQIRKQFPFKIRSSIVEGPPRPTSPLPEPKPAFASAPVSSYNSPMHTPRNTSVFEIASQTRAMTDGIPRPDSIITDLPMMWAPRISRANTPVTSASPMTELEMRQSDPRLRPLRTAEPSNPRRPTTSKPVALPLKVNPSVRAQEPGTSSPAETPSGNNSPQADGKDSPTRHPRRTSSVKLSLFPSPNPTPPVAPIRPVAPVTKDMRSLRRPASLQVRSNPAPFLSSVRSASGTRQPLKTSGSTPSLRSASATASTRPSSSAYKFTTPVNDLNGNAFLHSRSVTPVSMATSAASQRQQARDRNDSLTALPAPRASTLTRPKTGPRSNISSLPALDLGIPVIGLAPPAPPPTRGLPSIPTAKVAVAH